LPEKAFAELSNIFDHLRQRKHEATIIPEQKNIFRAFKETPLDQVKVVICAQDPFHTFVGDVPVANGLAFSINEDVKDVFFLPPSLRNILSEIQNDVYPMSFDPERLALNYKEE
jgi:uracil-DNA glycosylase